MVKVTLYNSLRESRRTVLARPVKIRFYSNIDKKKVLVSDGSNLLFNRPIKRFIYNPAPVNAGPGTPEFKVTAQSINDTTHKQPGAG